MTPSRRRTSLWLLALAVGLLGSAPADAETRRASGSQQQEASASRAPAQLSLALRRVRNSKGRVGCALFRGPKGFPLRPEKAVKRLWCPISDHKAVCKVQRSLPPGTYAAICIHDENGNGKLDTNWIGYPTEGAVASNHARGRLGPPSFEDAAFSVGTKPLTVRMKMGY